MEATFVKNMEGDNFRGDARLYKLNPPWNGEVGFSERPVKDVEYLIVSAANVPYSGPETYIFMANEKGEVTDWMDLPGSERGMVSHDAAIKNFLAHVNGE